MFLMKENITDKRLYLNLSEGKAQVYLDRIRNTDTLSVQNGRKDGGNWDCQNLWLAVGLTWY